ncbi:hypothetical protein IVB43_03545 [Bradyrhizobium sp. 48]|uniref:hypothetical protein n=1 Tax=Bradyrhizobium sp. 48 TaxID=2782676 RepID=UPI001FFB3DEE|nr:hypothetical protein [Bradyrhizobium sp. 48]MCK1441477.1 hypothetical protein [Bradyrhizobium sp. 48]
MKVFWAWQYDLPGKVSRHFIRGALEEAIRAVNAIEGIDEPDESFQNGLQLDYGRKGLKGSPDLAIEILKKIDGAEIFVGDVTPVGRGAPHVTDEGVASDGKALMNPNVAIELGYALKSKTTENVLMVMNGHYGKRADMPFDLGHKGGPIMYNLPPHATKEQIASEKKKLVAILQEALRAYLPVPTAIPFPELQPKIGKGIFFSDGEVLGANQNDRDKTAYTMPFRSVMWLRVIPTSTLDMPLSLQALLTSVARFGPFGMPAGGEPIRQNAYGVAYFTPAGHTANIDSLSQYTRDGEIWGVNADILRQGERGDGKLVLSLPMENLFVTSLSLYLDFARQVSRADGPVTVEAGIEGIAGRRIIHNGAAFVVGAGFTGAGDPMHLDRVVHRDRLKNFDKTEQDNFLIEFFRKVNANTGVPRPPGLYGRG